MSTTVAAPAPRVKRTVTEESFVSPADKPKFYSWDEEFLEFIASAPEAELQKYTIYVYRLRDRESRNSEGSYIDKLIPTREFDQAYLKAKAGPDGQGFGGGFFKIILKDGSGQRRAQGVWEISGTPRDPGAPGTAMTMPTMPGVDGQSAVTMEALKMAGNPQMMTVIMQLMMTASGHAMAMIREAMPKQPDLLQLVSLMRELQPAPAAPPPLDEFAQMQRTLMLKLLERSIEPGDPLASIKSVGGILEAVKQFSGANVKADWSSTLLATAPSLLDKVVGGIREYRLASEAQARIPQPVASQRVINVDDPGNQPHAQPQPQQPAQHAPQQTQPELATPGTLAWFLLKLEAGIINPNSTGDDLYRFVGSCKETGLIAEVDFNVLTSDKATVAMALQNSYNAVFGPDNEHLKRIQSDPARLEKLLDEYLAAAALDRPDENLGAPKPN